MALFTWPPQNINTAGIATEAKQDVTNTKLDALIAKNFATETTLAAMSAAQATAANQATANGKLDTLIAKDFATSAKQDTANGKLDTLIAKDFATAANQATTNGKLDTLIAKDFATETTLQKTRKWPYATHAKIVPTQDGTNEYYTYKTSGDVTVGTITINKTTGVIVYSPDKAV